MQPSERRQGIRFPLKLTCQVTFPFKNQCSFSGVTENLSRDGVLIRVRRENTHESSLRVGDWVRIALDLPDGESLPDRYLGCEATLSRISDGGPDALYLAFRIDQMDFRRSPEMVRRRNVDMVAMAAQGMAH
ncbi:MAG: PilZ domain-containing protein [Bryobacteraceae bacterium]